MLCACHGEPAYWSRDSRKTAGGWWECAVKRRERQRRVYAGPKGEKKRRQQRERYDTDPIFRISKRLHDDARKRRATIERRREALLGGAL